MKESVNITNLERKVKRMKRYDGYEQAEAFTGNFERLEPGGYICQILDVKAEEKDYGTLLRVAFDIAEGDNKGYFRQLFDKRKESYDNPKWPNGGMYYQTVKSDDLRFFKGFITAIEESNSGYKWNWDENTLKGKVFGGIFGEEEYENNNGEIKAAIKCRWVRSADKVRSGDFEIPEKKALNNHSQPNNTNMSAANDFYNTLAEGADDGDLPF